MKNQVGSSRMDTVLKLLLIAFVSLFAFSSGVYFGKQMSDNDYQLRALESDFSNSHVNVAENKNLDVTPEEAIVDDEVAALSEKYLETEREDLSAETRSVASSGTTHTNESEKSADQSVGITTESEKSQKPDLSAAHKAAVRVANNAAPTEAPKKKTDEKRIPSSLPKTVGASADVEFTVQVASYPTSDAAKAHANELVKKGFPAFPVEASVKGRTWYRVSVGSFKTLKEASSYRTELIKQANLQSAIVQRIQR